MGLDIYGRVRGLEGDPGFVPFRYQGQYHDVETGLYCNRFRYYSPAEGLYTQPDPIGLAGGNPTLYAYVGNPLWEVDPFGLAGWRLGGPDVTEILQGGPFNEKYYGFKEYWWSKDVTGHGGSAFKVYEKEGRFLIWKYDADENGQFLEGKHKGDIGSKIDMKDLKKCKG